MGKRFGEYRLKNRLGIAVDRNSNQNEMASTYHITTFSATIRLNMDYRFGSFADDGRPLLAPANKPLVIFSDTHKNYGVNIQILYL